MSRVFHRLSVTLLMAGVALLGAGLSAWAAGVRFNTTESIPLGIYGTSEAPVTKGAYVIWCPPETGVFAHARERGYIGAGYCPGGYGYLMKRVLAATTDILTVADEGVRVNGLLLPLSVPLAADGAGRAMPRYRVDQYPLTESELLLMSELTAVSFDGRYFGPVSRSQVVTVIRPILTW